MGAWGYGSDENDSTYDILGMSIGDRASAMQLTTKDRTQMRKYINAILPEHKTPGVVVWCTKQGIKLAKADLKVTIQRLKMENVDEGGWFEPNKRTKEIKNEIRMLKKVVSTNNAPKHTRVRGIFN